MQDIEFESVNYNVLRINYNAIFADRWIFKKLLKTKKSDFCMIDLFVENFLKSNSSNECFKDVNFLVLVISGIYS